EARVKRTFALQLPDIEASWAGTRLVSCYWQYYERQRQAGSNKGKQFLNGTIGPLYLRGELAPVYPLLLLCSEISNETQCLWLGPLPPLPAAALFCPPAQGSQELPPHPPRATGTERS
ncbi:MAG: hypothetical protein D3923_16510, partial [Candidatus Electrothrix sp. AR3]|nr:hypothetical protein [Candidatus Electrothrix sp. AR3]